MTKPPLYTLAAAPCAWGIWYPSHPGQIRGERYLSEIAELGFYWTELGPQTYLGDSASTIKALLGEKEISICAAPLVYPFPLLESFPEQFMESARNLAAELQAYQAKFLILMDDSGFYIESQPQESQGLQASKQSYLSFAAKHIAALRSELSDMGLSLLLHPHAGTCVETEDEIDIFLDAVEAVPLCFDIGHHTYSGGSPSHFLRTHFEVIAYIHIKNIDLKKKRDLEKEGLSVEDIFTAGVMVELEQGDIDIKQWKDELVQRQYSGFIVLEQDRFGMPQDLMQASVGRNKSYWENV